MDGQSIDRGQGKSLSREDQHIIGSLDQISALRHRIQELENMLGVIVQAYEQYGFVPQTAIDLARYELEKDNR